MEWTTPLRSIKNIEKYEHTIKTIETTDKYASDALRMWKKNVFSRVQRLINGKPLFLSSVDGFTHPIKAIKFTFYGFQAFRRGFDGQTSLHKAIKFKFYGFQAFCGRFDGQTSLHNPKP